MNQAEEAIRPTATLTERIDPNASRYKLSEPWAGYDYVVVSMESTLEGRPVTRIYAAKEEGPLTEALDERGALVRLAEYDGILAPSDLLIDRGYEVIEM